MRTLSTNWKAEAKKSTVKPVDLVVFSTNADPDSATEKVDRWSFCSDPHATVRYPNSVKKVGVVPPKIAMISRRFSVSDYRVTLGRDPTVRALFSGTRLKNKFCDVKIGWRALVEGDYAKRVRGLVHTWKNDETTVEISIKDVGGLLRGKKIPADDGKFPIINRHPLEALQDILDECGIPSGLYDAATLDPTTLPDKYQVLNITRQVLGTDGHASTHGLQEPTDAWSLAVKLLELLNGSFKPDEDGIYKFVQYDFTATPIKTITRRDVMRAKLDDASSNVTNRWEMEIPTLLRTPRIDPVVVAREDPNSVSDHQIPGGGTESGRFTKSLGANEWLDGQGFCFSIASGTNPFDDTITEDDTIIVWGAGFAGFSGCHFDTIDNGSTRPAYNDPDSTDKLVYLLLVGPPQIGTSKLTQEVISCKAATLSTTLGKNTDDNGAQRYQQVVFTIYQRDVFNWNGGAVNWASFVPYPTNIANKDKPNIHVYDITAAWHACTDKLSRTSYGAPTATVILHSFEHYDIEASDLLYVTDDVPLFFGKDGLDASRKWEALEMIPEWPKITVRIGLTEASAPAAPTTPEINPVFVWPVEDPDANLILKTDGTPVINNALGYVLHL